MSIVYVTEQRSKVSKRGEQLVISQGGGVVKEIAVGTITQVHIIGRGIRVTTPALVMLAQHNVEVVYLTQRGRFLAGHYISMGRYGSSRRIWLGIRG